MSQPMETLRQALERFQQQHLLDDWSRLTDSERQNLLQQIETLNLPLVQQLYRKSQEDHTRIDLSRMEPVPITPADHNASDAIAAGSEAITRGEVAALVVAGGQGTRLRCDQPKGMFEIGPVSNCTLFEIHAEKILARSRRHGGRIPYLVMTSPATEAETKSFVAEKRYFGLPVEDVIFFCQGTMPAVDAANGRILQEAPGKLALSPNGHGGALPALRDHGLLDELRRRGVRHIYYFQVDNPLTKIADPLFVGQHILARSEVSSKVVPKLSPQDRVGNFVLVDGRCSMIEYINLPKELAEARDVDGRLRIRAANPAIHIFDLEFLRRMAEEKTALPYHIARKCVKHWDGKQVVEPKSENALKFEMFIFDLLPRADRWLLVETTHREEFAPLKNMQGPDSPETVKAAMCNQARDWLAHAGIHVEPRDDWPLEICPLFALDADEFAARVPAGEKVAGPRYWK